MDKHFQNANTRWQVKACSLPATALLEPSEAPRADGGGITPARIAPSDLGGVMSAINGSSQFGDLLTRWGQNGPASLVSKARLRSRGGRPRFAE